MPPPAWYGRPSHAGAGSYDSWWQPRGDSWWQQRPRDDWGYHSWYTEADGSTEEPTTDPYSAAAAAYYAADDELAAAGSDAGSTMDPDCAAWATDHEDWSWNAGDY